jgi:Kdo2-lipid IVA lauroyltransferase/acyltransferase
MAVPLLKRVRRTARFHAIRAALALVALLPRSAILPLGRALGLLAATVFAGEVRKAMTSLAIAFPERSEGERARIVEEMFVHLAQSALELACIDRIDPILEEYVEVPESSARVYAQAHARGTGVVFVTGHVGNWELLARRLARTGLPCATIAKESNDARLTALIEQVRARGNLRTIWRGQPGAAREMLGMLKKGGALGLLIDQDTDVQSVFVPFFGKLAHTPRAAADLALRARATALVGFIHRKPEGGHRMEVAEIALPHGDDEAAAIELTARFSAAIERAIRAHPAEWVWMHQRWKTRPLDADQPTRQ